MKKGKNIVLAWYGELQLYGEAVMVLHCNHALKVDIESVWPW